MMLTKDEKEGKEKENQEEFQDDDDAPSSGFADLIANLSGVSLWWK
jgi:hypothetical protein